MCIENYLNRDVYKAELRIFEKNKTKIFSSVVTRVKSGNLVVTKKTKSLRHLQSEKLPVTYRKIFQPKKMW
jgi:hypothetical protein